MRLSTITLSGLQIHGMLSIISGKHYQFVRKYVGSRTLEHKGSSDKNGANSDKFNNAIRELEYQDNAGKN